MHSYEIRPRKDHRGVDLISDALPFGGLWYLEARAAVGYAMFYSRSHDAVISVYDEPGKVIETQEHAGEFKEWYRACHRSETIPLLRCRVTRHNPHDANAHE
jgi:hypothetical protein